MGRRVEVHRRRGLVERVIEQAEALLLREHPDDGAIDEGFVHRARLDSFAKRSAVRLGARQLDVDSGGQGEPCRISRVLGDRVHGVQEQDGEVVSDHDPLEAPRVAEQLRQIGGRRGDRHPVDLRVGVHDAARPAVAHGHLERREQHVGHFARTRRHRCVVAAGPRGRVPDEVLERRVHPRILQAAHVRGADRPDDVGVFGDALVHPPPAGVADHVEHRSQALVHAEGAHRFADQARHLLDGVGIERRPPGEGCGEGRRFPGGQARQALLVDDRGDAEAGLRAQAPLLAPQPRGALDGIDRAGAVHARQVADAVPRSVFVPRRGGELTRHRRDQFVALVDPEAPELGGLLLQRHLRDERADARRTVRLTHSQVSPSPLRSVRRRCAARRG